MLPINYICKYLFYYCFLKYFKFLIMFFCSQRVPSYYGDCFIANKEEVDEHVKKIYSKQQKPLVM